MEREFNFPVEPYQVQREFMSELYDCLSNCKSYRDRKVIEFDL